MSMFCYQCEQTAKGTGCTIQGVCGKSPEAATLMDLLIYGTKGLSMYAHRAMQLGATDDEINAFAISAMFTTVTNVNFDLDRLQALLKQLSRLLPKAKALYENACKDAGKIPENLSGPAQLKLAEELPDQLAQAAQIGVLSRRSQFGDEIVGLQELVTYGIKGLAAYAYHARVLGKEDNEVYAFVHQALDFLTKPHTTVDELLALALKTGEANLKVMELLDAANTGAYGHPVPTKVRITPVKGKAILVSGHDLKDLEELLKQTEGKGINVYTHGEMLPTHGYPKLKKYKHFVGNYGGAWQEQRKEFDEFPGAILMTTNCIQMPKDTYKNRIFTCDLVAYPGVTHISNRDFTPLIEAALAAEGFPEDGLEKYIIVGFARNAVLSVADKVIDAVKSGAIRHFFLIGGCDGAKAGRNYYTEFAQAVPKDCVILTLACGKYRFNKLDFGDIGGIPRLLDIGQCNDAYSAVQIAVALAQAFKTDVNSLPLSFIISWYEQKAVAVLLTLLYLGIKNMRLGPTLPACLTPSVLNILIDKFNISLISTVENDLQACLQST